MNNKNKKIYLMRPTIGKDELKLVKQVIESGQITEGPVTDELEKVTAHYIGSKHAIVCSSATTGLELALRALKIGTGDEVIIPDFTHPATALAVMTVGATPVLIDVNVNTCTVDAERIESAITPKTKAVIPVSIFGIPLDMDSINDVKQKYALPIIEDAACSLGSEYKRKKIGSLADISVFSFHPRKIFTTGDGGLLTTNNDQWNQHIRSMKSFGFSKTKEGALEFIQWGTNYRMSEILSAVALGQIRRIDTILHDRITKAHIYDNLLSEIEEIYIPGAHVDSSRNFQTYIIYLKRPDIRDRIIEEMRTLNIQTQIGTYALHLQPFFKNLNRIGTLENSLKLYNQLLSLPLHHQLTYRDQKKVIAALIKMLAKNI